MSYPPQRCCREARGQMFGFELLMIDFGAAADITPRFHVLTDVGGDLGELSFGGDDFKALLRRVAEALQAIRQGLRESAMASANPSTAPPSK